MGRLESSIATAAIVSVVTISAMSFSVWQSWWLSIIWLTASLLVAVRTAPLSVAAETESGMRQ
jgi:hypothetical protein